ncbi:PilN domain-containing protein [Methyloferula stellata]|uniref:PilN domain-containing protein n=1 Tax=Methyloferula stellata TaxID=876270 RepID=UPI0003762D60|nr:PilN domain-containing protein [Methyloferula stellata]
MQIKTIFDRWIKILAGLVAESRAFSQSRKSVLVTQEDGCFVVRHPASPESHLLGKVMVGTKMPDGMAEALRDHFIIFEIAADRIVTRRITVPAQAQDFLPGIVRNQIERLSPWLPTQAIYGIDAKPNPDDAGTLNVCVPIASRASIDVICNELAASGLSPNRIAVRTEAGVRAPLLALWTRPAQGSERHAQNLPRMIGTGLAAGVALSTAASLWAIYSTGEITAEHEDVAARTAALQRDSQSSRKLQDIALLKPPQRAWVLKENSPVTVLTLEALSRALPDNAYLTEFQLENASLRIIGFAADAPSLIAALERSGRFSAVHFFAPTTKGNGGDLYRFYIETRVDEHPQLIGD